MRARPRFCASVRQIGLRQAVASSSVATMLQSACFPTSSTCRNCGWRTVCGRDDAVARLRLIGLLRREPDPDEELVAALLGRSGAADDVPDLQGESACRDAIEPTDDEDGDWQAAVLCEVCRAADCAGAAGGDPGREALCRLSGESGSRRSSPMTSPSTARTAARSSSSASVAAAASRATSGSAPAIRRADCRRLRRLAIESPAVSTLLHFANVLVPQLRDAPR